MSRHDEHVADALRLAEVTLREPLRTWRARMMAVVAECFEPQAAALIVAKCTCVLICDQTDERKRQWANAAPTAIWGTLDDCWGNDGAKVKSAREWLLRIAAYADAREDRPRFEELNDG